MEMEMRGWVRRTRIDGGIGTLWAFGFGWDIGHLTSGLSSAWRGDLLDIGL